MNEQIDVTSIAGLVAITWGLMEALKRTPWAGAVAPWEAIASIIIGVTLGLMTWWSGVGFSDMHPWHVVLNIMGAILGAAAVQKFIAKPTAEAIKQVKGADNGSK